MTEIKDLIKDKRPTLGDSSVTTYNSILKNLYKKCFHPNDKTFTVETKNFDNTSKVLDFLGGVPPNKRKTILSALVIITDNKKYRDLMLSDIKDYNAEIGKQEKSDSQKENWVSSEDIKSIWDTLKKNADLLYKKSNLTPNDLQAIQSFIIVSLLGGVFIPPRRSKDIVDWKIKNISKETDNYLEKSSIYYNSYKTSKFYGEQIVPIPTQLKNILNKWIKVNPTDYLVFDTNMNPLTSVKLNQRLNKLFGGKKVGVNLMRHAYLTGKYGDTIAKNKDIEDTMSDMGSSKSMLTTYVKE
jgi:integrase